MINNLKKNETANRVSIYAITKDKEASKLIDEIELVLKRFCPKQGDYYMTYGTEK